MAVVRFSHNYPKIHGQTSALLLSVRPIKIDANTPNELLEYDTKYDGGYFNLQYGDYVQLIFLGNFNIPFTTIRKHYPPQKEDYYEGCLGETFDVVIRKENKIEQTQRKEIYMCEEDFDANVRKFVCEIADQMHEAATAMVATENEIFEKLKNEGPKQDFDVYINLGKDKRDTWCYNHNMEYRSHAIRYFALKKLADSLKTVRL